MPSEHPPPDNSSSAGKGPAETAQPLSLKGGVRALLGLPLSDSGTRATVALTAPSAGHRYSQSPLPATEEDDEWFRATADDEGFIEEVEKAVAHFSAHPTHGIAEYERDTQGDLPRPPLRNSDLSLVSRRAHTAGTPLTAPDPSTTQREQTSLRIPGVSAQRTDFPALAQPAGSPMTRVEEEPWAPSPHQAAARNAPVSLPHAPETTTVEDELLTRLEHLVTEGARARKDSEGWPPSLTPARSSPVEPMGVQRRERGGSGLAQRVDQLQRTVRELAATVSAQAARSRDESQAHPRERKTPPLQPQIIINRAEASSATTRAFWERSRLSRAHLKTGR